MLSLMPAMEKTKEKVFMELTRLKDVSSLAGLDNFLLGKSYLKEYVQSMSFIFENFGMEEK